MQKENKMGYMPIGRLILSMSLPMMLSMLMQALYNVVDSIYVARVSEDCLSALSLAFPAQNILIGLAIITAIILFAFFLVQLIPGFTTSAKPVEPPSPRYVLHSPSEMPPMRG